MITKLGDFQISGLSFLPDSTAGFAATQQGLWMTLDDGRTWQDGLAALFPGEPVPFTTVVCAAQPGQAGLVIAGFKGGILRSVDGGQTWEAVSFGSPPPVVTALAVSGQGLLFAGTAEDGVFLSQDQGQTWTHWNFGLFDGHVYSLALLHAHQANPLVFAGTETGIFSSHNRGRTWREVDFPMDAGAILAIKGFENANGGEMVFAGTETGALLRSLDRGLSWKQVGSENFRFEISAIGEADGILVASGDELWISTDRGDSWLPWPGGPAIQGTWTCLASGRPLFAGTSAGCIYNF